MIWSATVAKGPVFSASRPSLLLKADNDASIAYDLAPDGRFLMHTAAVTTEAGTVASRSQIVLVHNWFDELRARVP